ncbi:putative secretion protein [Cronobacter sakazakii 701]|nr:putative secretion protein [Cronobacter sakazakii 701]
MLSIRCFSPAATSASSQFAATVQLYNSEGPFARFFSGVQIHLISLLHYVY